MEIPSSFNIHADVYVSVLTLILRLKDMVLRRLCRFSYYPTMNLTQPHLYIYCGVRSDFLFLLKRQVFKLDVHIITLIYHLLKLLGIPFPFGHKLTLDQGDKNGGELLPGRINVYR